MELRIDQDTTLRDIQREFNAWYPNLKLEFYRHRRAAHQTALRNEKYSGGEKMSVLSRYAGSGRINIDSYQTVDDVENAFNDCFGITVEIFRRSGNLWIETSLTDNWSLDQQNELGAAFFLKDRRENVAVHGELL